MMATTTLSAEGCAVTVDSHANVSFLEGRGIVDAGSAPLRELIARLLQQAHNFVLVLREHLSKAIGLLHQLLHIADPCRQPPLRCLP